MGPPATLILLTLTDAFGRVAKPFDEWYSALFPEDEQNASERLYRRLMSGREDAIAEGSVNSLTDVLFTGNTRSKQAVVALLARRFRSDFAPALQMALNDPEASIRVQAATAASAIEERFHARRVELEDAARRRWDDRAASLRLARHLDEYAYAGVLDLDRQLAIMTAALEAYRSARSMEHDRDGGENAQDEEIDVAIGRLLLRLDRIDEAAEHLEKLEETSQDPRPTLWHAECLYRLRRFDELRRRIHDPRLSELAMSDSFGNVNPMLNLWQISALSDLASDLKGDLADTTTPGAT
jgi:tetratricopeptide (TPR) repeat protein